MQEIKLRAEGSLSALLGDPLFRDAASVAYQTLYYDTSDRRLLAKHLAYIVNLTPSGVLGEINPTDSLSGGIFAMEDWIRPQSGPGPELEVFGDLEVGRRIAALLGDAPLEILFQGRFRRYEARLQEGGSVLLLFLDVGEIRAGDRSEPLAELKLILASGSSSFLEETAAAFRSRYALVPEGRTKHRRGLLLLGES